MDTKRNQDISEKLQIWAEEKSLLPSLKRHPRRAQILHDLIHEELVSF